MNAKTPDRPWTHPEHRRLVTLRKCGWSFKDIGSELYRTAVACRIRYARLAPHIKEVSVPTTWKHRLGAKMRAAREGNKMGRDELAYKTGLSVRTIRRLEQGEHVSTRALDLILEVLLLDLTPVRRVVEVQS